MTSEVLSSIHRLAKIQPQKTALTDGQTSLTYRELAEGIRTLALKLKVFNGVCVAIEMENSIDWVMADLACIASQVVTVPLPIFFTASQREHAMRNAGVQCCISDGLKVTHLAYQAVLLPERTAKITYTSGTTGSPKGVCLSQPGMEQVATSLLSVIGAAPASHTAAVLPLAVLLENVAGCYATLLAGGCYDVRPQAVIGLGAGMKPDWVSLVRYLAMSHATSCILVPEMLRGILHVLSQGGMRLPDMQFVAVGGAKVSPRLLEQSRQRNLPVYQGYGLSECASVVSVNTPQAVVGESVGQMLPHVDAHVAEDGEICINHPAFLGYVGEKPGSMVYATGDLGLIDGQGFLHITGRKKNVLITAFGRNVSPEWPESELLAQPEIAQCLVVGDGASYLAALLVPTGEQVSDVMLQKAVDQANARLPAYARIHQWARVRPFTVLEGLLTGTGRPKREMIVRFYHTLIHTLFKEEAYANIF
ncbi:MAG: AMP-binding protein [Nitrospirales bacterium]|nr:AMP-binding protein [Nitrospirales bacterium]MDR4488306.1 AMP-binding protein [Nitrospirales bacterium]